MTTPFEFEYRLSGRGQAKKRRRQSGSDIRNSPDREKTQEDLERIASAQLKRDRKAARAQRATPAPAHSTPWFQCDT